MTVDPHLDDTNLTCSICGETYNRSNVINLIIPTNGKYGYIVQVGSVIKNVALCKDCISALQRVIFDRYEKRKE